jgi:uncharacterized protein YndB with AHSA1/START domain
LRIFAFALVLGLAAPAAAEIVDVAGNGMEIKQVTRIAAPPERIWAAIIQPANWWSSDHTFSGSSANITFDAKLGGCWCETMPNGGGVVHMTVTHMRPPAVLVTRGSLGPFYNLAADGTLTYSLSASGAETELTLTFRAGGYVKEGFQKWAPAVDGVLAQQMGNLKKYLETTAK